MKLTCHIDDFMGLVNRGEVEIYNEFSLQHELGIFLRNRLSAYKIEFERNVSHFNLSKCEFVKNEIDISIVDRKSGKTLSVIELKYPRNGQVPEQMFSFCKDISFVEQLVERRFQSGVFVAVADSPLFYSGKSEGIYGMFRGGCPINGRIPKPTGKATGARNEIVDIRNTYEATWHALDKPTRQTKYCRIEVAS